MINANLDQLLADLEAARAFALVEWKAAKNGGLDASLVADLKSDAVAACAARLARVVEIETLNAAEANRPVDGPVRPSRARARRANWLAAVAAPACGTAKTLGAVRRRGAVVVVVLTKTTSTGSERLWRVVDDKATLLGACSLELGSGPKLPAYLAPVWDRARARAGAVA